MKEKVELEPNSKADTITPCCIFRHLSARTILSGAV